MFIGQNNSFRRMDTFQDLGAEETTRCTNFCRAITPKCFQCCKCYGHTPVEAFIETAYGGYYKEMNIVNLLRDLRYLQLTARYVVPKEKVARL